MWEETRVPGENPCSRGETVNVAPAQIHFTYLLFSHQRYKETPLNKTMLLEDLLHNFLFPAPFCLQKSFHTAPQRSFLPARSDAAGFKFNFAHINSENLYYTSVYLLSVPVTEEEPKEERP